MAKLQHQSTNYTRYDKRQERCSSGFDFEDLINKLQFVTDSSPPSCYLLHSACHFKSASLSYQSLYLLGHILLIKPITKAMLSL